MLYSLKRTRRPSEMGRETRHGDLQVRIELHNEDGIMPEPHAIKATPVWSNSPYNSYPLPGSRGSLLEELDDHDIIPDYRMANDMYHPQEPTYHPHPHLYEMDDFMCLGKGGGESGYGFRGTSVL